MYMEISAGYDVYAGGAGNEADGTATDGRSGKVCWLTNDERSAEK